MIISLIGYMGSGKSHISKVLSTKLKIKVIDLDHEISLESKLTIPEIFEKRGEIYFRKKENEILKKILASGENIILSVGGGTPAYYNNMDLLTDYSESIFLRTSIKNLVERVSKQKDKRPLISKINKEDLPEFIAKHLFERQNYYSQAKYTVITDDKEPEEIATEIISLLHFPAPLH